jgi:rod shape-determining protein MreC
MRTVIASKKPAWITLAVALVFHALLLSFQTNKRIDTSFVRVWLLDSLGPVEKVVDISFEGVENIWSGYVGLVHVRRDNLKLQTDNEQLRMELTQKSEDAAELARLRQLMDLQATPIGKTVVARVVGKDPSQGGQYLTIDKGTRSGVVRDAPIITREGVVGRVTSAGKLFSVVQLIVDSQSGVGFIVRSSRRLGILKGTGGAELEMEYIDDDNDIKQGDELITSGQDQIYPKGLPVGVVVSVAPRQGGNFKVVHIRPSVNFGRLEEVLVMTDHLPEVPTGQVP